MIFFRERKREREREDLWKKLETLSLNNARKEGISLDLVRFIYLFFIMIFIIYDFIYDFIIYFSDQPSHEQL